EFPGSGDNTPRPKGPQEMDRAMAERLEKAKQYFQQNDARPGEQFKPIGGQ
ncbi:MAG: hypothetical protein HKO93_01810, partial [Flavobacteriales bacterium]|nr:hypothetical protein [Flavobacteriales bacterium]